MPKPASKPTITAEPTADPKPIEPAEVNVPTMQLTDTQERMIQNYSEQMHRNKILAARTSVEPIYTTSLPASMSHSAHVWIPRGPIKMTPAKIPAMARYLKDYNWIDVKGGTNGWLVEFENGEFVEGDMRVLVRDMEDDDLVFEGCLLRGVANYPEED
jgi:hypothetical protein